MKNPSRRPPEAPLAALGALLAAFAACAPSGAAPEPKAAPAASGPRVVLPSGRALDVEIARTEEEKAQGLMYRESMPRGHGMVFLFDEPAIRPFWMKNCHFPLDMIYTLKDGTIVDVLANVPPCAADPCPSYPPKAKADTVVEVNAGVAAEEKAAPGTKLAYRDVPDR